VLVRRRDRHRHCHHHDPRRHLHARMQVRDRSFSFIASIRHRRQLLMLYIMCTASLRHLCILGLASGTHFQDFCVSISLYATLHLELCNCGSKSLSL
jgi:hypothetical protein